jgi:hypothetical protein
VTTLPDFEDDLRDALEPQLEAQAEAIGQTLKDTAEENFRQYAAENDYSISHIWDDAELIVERSSNGYTARVEWPELTALFSYGVDPHTISGSPLAFFWPGPPEGTRPQGAPSYVASDEVNWGSVTGGIPESRAIRGALDYVRFEMEGRVEL